MEVTITVINTKGEGAFIFEREYDSFKELFNELNDYEPKDHDLNWRRFGLAIEVLDGKLTQNEIEKLEINDIEVYNIEKSIDDVESLIRDLKIEKVI